MIQSIVVLTSFYSEVMTILVDLLILIFPFVELYAVYCLKYLTKSSVGS